MTIRLNGSTSGYTEIDASAVAGSNTLVLPGGNGTADQALVTNGSGTLSWANRGRMVLETAQNSTSGTSIDFTGIPSWVKRVTVMFNGVSTNGTSTIQIQIGSGSFVSTGYLGAVAFTGSGSTGANLTTGFGVANSIAAASIVHGIAMLSAMGSNVWSYGINGGYSHTAAGINGGGSVTLSGTLDRIRITTVNGTDTFDAGSINILYEG